MERIAEENNRGIDKDGNISDVKSFLTDQIIFLQSMEIDAELLRKSIHKANTEISKLKEDGQQVGAGHIASVIRVAILEDMLFVEEEVNESAQIQENQEGQVQEDRNDKQGQFEKEDESSSQVEQITEIIQNEEKIKMQQRYAQFLKGELLSSFEEKIVKREFETAIDNLQQDKIPLTPQTLSWQIERMREKGIEAYKFQNNEQKKVRRQRESEEQITKKNLNLFKEKYGVDRYSKEGVQIVQEANNQARRKMKKRIQDEEQKATRQLVEYMEKNAESGKEDIEKLYIMAKVYEDNTDAISKKLKSKYAQFIADIALLGASQLGMRKRSQRRERKKNMSANLADQLDRADESKLARLIRKYKQFQDQKREKVRQLRKQEAQQKAQWHSELRWKSEYYDEEVRGNQVLRDSIEEVLKQKEEEDQQLDPSPLYKKIHGYNEDVQKKTRNLLDSFVQSQKKNKDQMGDESMLYRPYFFPEEYRASDKEDDQEVAA